MKLFIPISVNILLVIAVYLADKSTRFNKLPYIIKQIIIGVLFGAVSCFASNFGVEVLGTVANTRDAAPLSAGLIFGAPAGVISGVIGGLYRWFSVYWGAGEYTRLACTIATVLAGLMAAGLRKLMFDDKKPVWGYGIFITVVCEVIHMLLIFLTNMDDSSYAFGFVKAATLPMILGNGLAVGLSLVAVSLLSREGLIGKKENEHISQTFQRWLLICIVVAYAATGVFSFFLQNSMARIETQEMFSTAVNDVKTDVRGKSDAHLLDIAKAIKEKYEAEPDTPLGKWAEEYDVIEINVVDDGGSIINSTNVEFVGGFNMNDTPQSAEFMVLVKDAEEYVQEYGPMGRDPSVLRKYAGVRLSDGGYIQVGYSAEQFHDQLDEFVIDVTKNRSVGSGGFVAVCDDKLNLVTHDKMNGKHISSIGIEPNEEMKLGVSASMLFLANVTDGEGNHGEEYIYVFDFAEGYCIIAALKAEEAMFMRDSSVYNTMFMQVIVFATLFVFIYVLVNRVIINNLKKVNSSLAQITEGNLDVTVDVRTNEEFASLSDDINSTVDTLKRYIAEAAARIDKELEYAKQIQLSALPANLPGDEDYCIYAQMIAAKEVGGDFYDFYRLDDDTVAILVADVSGKGIPAAMFMMTAKTIIKDLAESGLDVNDIFTKANEKLCENNDSGMFVTAWMGILHIPTGVLRYANAGHNPPLIKQDGAFKYLRSRPGFVLAGLEGVRYRVNELVMKPGDRIFLYTDGVTEATDTENRLYGETNLLSFMNRNAEVGARDLLTGLKSAIDSFAGDAPQFDDITVLMLDYKIKKGEATMENRTFPASVEALGDVLGFAEEKLEGFDCSMKNSMAICVALEEVFVNVARYAYGEGQGEAELYIGFDKESRNATFVLSDSGVPFDPLEKQDPDITLSAEEREIGGLGIYIAKKTMDSIAYTYENGKNILTMIKKI